MDNGTFNLSRGQTPLTEGSEGKTPWRLLLFDSFYSLCMWVNDKIVYSKEKRESGLKHNKFLEICILYSRWFYTILKNLYNILKKIFSLMTHEVQRSSKK